MPRPGARRWTPFAAPTIAALLLALATAVLAQDANTVGESALKQIESLMEQKLARTAAQTKLDSQFLYALNPPTFRQAAPGMKPDLKLRPDGRVLVDIEAVVSQELLERIEALGGKVVSSFAAYKAIRALVPLSSLEPLAARPDVMFVARAHEAETNTGSITGEGDVTHRAAATRNVFGVTGAGVNVGVMSDSVDFLAASQGLGDIGPVTVLAGQTARRPPARARRCWRSWPTSPPAPTCSSPPGSPGRRAWPRTSSPSRPPAAT
jgi:hypothetical protein